jgi:hypothetical protein
MKRFLPAIALVCVFSIPAVAGDIPTLGSPQPPPQGTAAPNSPGDIPTSGAAEQELSSDALSALLSLLGFLAV